MANDKTAKIYSLSVPFIAINNVERIILIDSKIHVQKTTDSGPFTLAIAPPDAVVILTEKE